MLEFKEGITGTSSSENGNQSSATVATTMPLRASTSRQHSHSGSSFCSESSSKKSPSGVPSSAGFEPQADVVLHPSALHLVERIFKRLMKLRKKALLAGYSSCFSTRAAMDDGAIRSYVDVDVDMERGYDSDEHTFVSADTPTSSASSMGSSSFESTSTSSHGTQLGTQLYSANFHRPGSQMMASMLLSLLNDDVGFTLEEDDDGGSGDESDEEYHLGGPRESAWHQPEDEILTEQEWRMMRYGHLQPAKPAAAAAAAAAKLQSPKYLVMGAKYNSSSKQPTMAAAARNSSSSYRSQSVKHRSTFS